MTPAIPSGAPDTGHRPFPPAERAGTLVHRFLDTAAAHPGRDAVVTPATRWTYRETEELSARVAAGLVAAGLRPGQRVALLFSHGAEMIAALLGVLRAGLSYVPLDAAYPEPRLAFMAADSGAAALVTVREALPRAAALAGDRPVLAYEDLARHDSGEPEARATPDGEAYVLYTSGSTGRPKPVTQVHRNVLHHTRVWTDGLRIGPGDRLTLQSAYSWDSAVQDTFAALLNGAALYPVDLKSLGVSGLLEWMARERLTVYHSTLPVFRALVRAMESRGTALPAMRMLALGGDTLHLADLEACRRAFGPHCRVAGAYGSTECSCALLRVADPDYRPPTGVFPLGLPVTGTTVRLQDPEGRTVEGPGEGEIVVVSPYLAPGAAAPDLSYRTGDLARRLPDGTLLLIGRVDFQVKISGIRVETGEVESALKDLPQVREAVVMPYTDRLGERQLAAHLVAEPGTRPGAAALRAALRGTLPDHAVPTAYVLLDALPLTANHKIDRRALPDPLTAAQPAGGSGPYPGGSLERAVADAWYDVIGVADAGPDDNFFDLGGTSLRMAAVHERLTRTVAPGLRMTDLYRAPTVRSLARLIRRAAGPSGPDTGDAAAGTARGARRRTVRRPRRTETTAHHSPTLPPPGGDRTVAPGGNRD
ncbi:non-ribosomal peptide synthetase [Streptomyces sp. OfavH-34-F]|uniref:non-ribosomal peptide synthetase n=1 Tax=Streptomyces sp. OfavH-34-F TaxID=2917760 RepID=UPI001EF1637C|nr:non-ribosomal peptide synthetase [Streptomyces sp. OfavH-34-F]MCG7528280.1 non-ribosomal peptide synthetase [Streptomyces sp. OfavH-34-F]